MVSVIESTTDDPILECELCLGRYEITLDAVAQIISFRGKEYLIYFMLDPFEHQDFYVSSMFGQADELVCALSGQPTKGKNVYWYKQIEKRLLPNMEPYFDLLNQ